MAEEDNSIVMKGLGQDDNHNLARLLEGDRLDVATPLVKDSHNFKVDTAPSCIEDVKAEAGVGTVVFGHMKKYNVTEEVAGSIDVLVC